MHLGSNGEGMAYMEILFDLPSMHMQCTDFYNVDESHTSHILLMFKGIFPKSSVFSTLVNRLRTKINLKKRRRKF